MLQERRGSIPGAILERFWKLPVRAFPNGCIGCPLHFAYRLENLGGSGGLGEQSERGKGHGFLHQVGIGEAGVDDYWN